MRDVARERHRLVWKILDALNAGFLHDAGCYFGGGTRIVLELDEYRESADVDFLCADQAGYRALRSSVSQSDFGDVFRGEYTLARDIRSDMYGIRTFLEVDGQALKFEIIREGRISLVGARIAPFPITVLDHATSAAEKLLANADRGEDGASASRDLVDLAFMAQRWEQADLAAGLAAAAEAYGELVARALRRALRQFGDEAHRQRCLNALGVTDTRRLDCGLRALRRLVGE
jgi:hypothetical protein